MSTVLSYSPPQFQPLPPSFLTPPPLDEIKLRNLLDDAKSCFFDIIFNDSDDNRLVDALYLIDARKLCLASYLWDIDQNSKEAIDLLESIVNDRVATASEVNAGKAKTGRQSLQYAYACELLCFILANQCCQQQSSDDIEMKTKRSFQVAKLASSSQFDVPFAQFLTFIDKLWQIDDDGKSHHRTISMKNVLSYGFQIATVSASCLAPSISSCLPNLQRSAYDGLVEAQELLVLFWSHSPLISERKLATFIAWSLHDAAIDRLLLQCQRKSISEMAYTIDKVLSLTEFEATTTNNSLWVRRLRRLTREQIQHRISKYCSNCLLLDCSLDDCTEPERIHCSTCDSVGYCSITCRREHWQSTHQYWCRETPKDDFKVFAIEYVPKVMIDNVK